MRIPTNLAPLLEILNKYKWRVFDAYALGEGGVFFQRLYQDEKEREHISSQTSMYVPTGGTSMLFGKIRE